ncbi:hypothetical protein N0V83_002554 [Neocucurbitaria cava]|uniref:DUF7730 domain-containing protein n=1 Tax=Neocucurbitaria cava TaxID=798079 RepID=A0A9W9CNY5_9PLEO|nr:hypothetical protein N0V83_002554 [Neocucurbitaria cava]
MLLPAILFKPTKLSPLLTSGNGKDGEISPPARERKPRVLGEWSGKVDDQSQCAFLIKLPAEIRNEIYEYVFAEPPGASDFKIMEEEKKKEKDQQPREQEDEEEEDSDATTPPPSPPPPPPPPLQPSPSPSHPLSLLLTCRKLNTEATLLAYRLHPFRIEAPDMPFYKLHNRTLILPRPLFQAISRVSMSLGENKHASPIWAPAVQTFISHMILLSPNIGELVVRFRTPVGYRRDDGHFVGSVRPPSPSPPSSSSRGRGEHDVVEVLSCREHVPEWLSVAFAGVARDPYNFWRKSEKWAVFWPDVAHPEIHNDDDGGNDEEEMHRRWDACLAVLKQEGTGRKVRVRLRYEGQDEEDTRKPQRKGLGVTLVPGIPAEEDMLDLEAVTGRDGLEGLVYDPGEEYWEGLRAMKIERGEGGRGSDSR